MSLARHKLYFVSPELLHLIKIALSACFWIRGQDNRWSMVCDTTTPRCSSVEVAPLNEIRVISAHLVSKTVQGFSGEPREFSSSRNILHMVINSEVDGGRCFCWPHFPKGIQPLYEDNVEIIMIDHLKKKHNVTWYHAFSPKG